MLALVFIMTGAAGQVESRADALPEQTDIATKDSSSSAGETGAYTTVKHLLSAGTNAVTEDGTAAYSNIVDTAVTVSAIQKKGGKYAKCTAESKKKVEIQREYSYKLTYNNTVGAFMKTGFTDNKGQHHGATHLVERYYKQYQVYSQVYSYTVTNDSTQTIDYYYFIYIWRELIDDDYHETSAKDVLTYCIQYGASISNSNPVYAQEKSTYDNLSADKKYKIACAIYYGPHRDKNGTYYKTLDSGMSQGVLGYDPETWSATFWKKYIAAQLYIWTVTNPGKFSYSDALKTAKLLDAAYATTDADHCASFLKNLYTYVENATKIPSFMQSEKEDAKTRKLVRQTDGTYKLVLTDSREMLKTGTLECDDENVKISVDSGAQLTLSANTELPDVVLSFQKNAQVPEDSGLLYYIHGESQNMVSSVVTARTCNGYVKLSTSGVDETQLSIHKISDPSNQNEIQSIEGAGFAVYTTHKSASVYDPVTKETMVDDDGNALNAEDYIAGYLYRPSSGIWKMLPYTENNLKWIVAQGYSYHTAYQIAYYVKQGYTSEKLPDTYCIVTDSTGYASTGTLKMSQNNGGTVSYCSYYMVEYEVPEPYALPYAVEIKQGNIVSGQVSAKWNEGESGYENPEQTVTNTGKYGSIRIYKYEDGSLTPLSGVVFEIFHDAACTRLFTTAVTDDSGIAMVENVLWGTYYIREQQGQPIHVKDTGISEVKVSAGKMSSVDKSNVPAVVQIHLQKQIDENNLPDDFDASLYSVEGAEYTLYAGETIFGSNNQVLYEADEEIYTLVCDAEGFASVDAEFAKNNLRLGRYYLKETKAPYGFLLDEKIYKIDAAAPEEIVAMELDDADEYQQTSTVLNIKADIDKEQVELNGIRIYKYAEKSGGTETISLEGAVFSVYNVSRMENDGIFISDDEFAEFEFTDAQYDDYRMIVSDDSSNVYTMTTDSQGMAETRKLPDAVYAVVEVEAPKGYARAANQKVILPEDARSGAAYVRVENKEKLGYMELVKIADMPSGVTYTDTKYGRVAHLDYSGTCVQGIEFQVYDENMQEVEVIATDQDGVARSGQLPLGVYYVKEISTFAGLVLDTKLHKIVIQEQSPQETPKVKLELTNEPMTTELVIYKEGETVMPSKKKGFAIDNLPLEGVVFGIYNKEDIYDRDGNSLLPAGMLMGVAVTDENGEALFQEKLWPGDYYYQELQPLEGFVPDDTKYEFTLTLLSNVPVERIALNKDTPLVNRYYKAAVKLRKVDGSNHDICLGGVEFDLYDATTNEKIGTYTTDANGEIYIAQMPYGSWYFKEKKALTGYEIDVSSYDFQITEKEAVVELLVENQPELKLGYEDAGRQRLILCLAAILGIGLLTVLKEVVKRRWKQ